MRTAACPVRCMLLSQQTTTPFSWASSASDCYGTLRLSLDLVTAPGARRDEVSGTAHLQELIENIDFRSVQIPVGTRAKYVPATDEPVRPGMGQGRWGGGLCGDRG